VSEPVDPLAGLSPQDRRDVKAIAADAEVPPDVLIPEIVAAYLRLLRDVPGALPRNPLAGIRAGARRRSDI
tara:strand:+ start:6214 stop:6426 length:213 start_codon:yes stop_codon:yes gene_type:complete